MNKQGGLFSFPFRLRCQLGLIRKNHIVHWHIYDTDLFCPSHPPSKWLKVIFFRWLKLNFRNGFSCWNLTHNLIRQSRSFFGQKMGCRTLNWVCTARPNLGVFFYFQNTAFLLLYYSACKKATSMAFILVDRGYPAVRFEYKTTSETYLVA